MTQTNISLNAFVYIIESPGDFDLLNGQIEGQALTNSLNLCRIRSTYSLVCNRRTFLEAITNRLINARNHYDCPPILHFSMHGAEGGIGLTDGDFISWDELRELLTQLNTRLGFLPLICFSSCYGINSWTMEYNNQAISSFAAILGHSGELFWSNSAVAYITFYNRLFYGSPIEQAVEAMKAAIGDNNFYYFPAENIKNLYALDSLKQELMDNSVLL
ncbi:MAG: hypothetical protein HC773_25500 [Scytonema sp. CRU_2_7]|nr:hypothetical protein [Scytonema sp. CRU_2_7]